MLTIYVNVITSASVFLICCNLSKFVNDMPLVNEKVLNERASDIFNFLNSRRQNASG